MVAPLKIAAGALAVAALPAMLAALGAVLLVGTTVVLLFGEPIRSERATPLSVSDGD